MDDEHFDQALIAAAFAAIAEHGWHHLALPEACMAAGLDPARARARVPTRISLLLRFGEYADRAALSGEAPTGTVSERLFDLLMRRIDVLQTHRAGVIALLRAAPADPAAAALLAGASLVSMRWLLETAGVAAAGPLGILKVQGLLAVWLWTVRAWQRDDSPDLAATMAALDAALDRAGQIARALPGQPEPAPVQQAAATPDAAGAAPDASFPAEQTEPSPA